MEQYSVLMSLYDKESPENLRQALDSMLHQTLSPDQIVLVKDGPLTMALEATLAEYTQARPDLFTIIALAENHGLAYALDKGLRACRNELVARMDTDDISLPERCEAQIRAFREHPEMSIVGGLSYLFVGTPDNIIPKVRKKPLDQEGIVKFIRRRNPLGHPTVMYKKSEVLRCGSYDGSLRGVEDYDLFSRMINSGCIAMNLPVPVLLFRGREGGMARSKSNADRQAYIAVQRRIWKRGHCSFGDYLYIWCAMTAAQIMPERLYAALQQKFFRTNIPGGKGGRA